LVVSYREAGILFFSGCRHGARCLEDLAPVLVAEPERLDVALGVVVVVPGLRVDASHRAATISDANRMLSMGMTLNRTSMPLMIDAGAKKTLFSRWSFRSGFFRSWAIPR